MQQGRLLLVDDDPDMRAMVSAYLQREGFAVEEAATAATARQFFENPSFDLVLLDVRLPDADGLDLLRDLRSHGRTPVIMLTGKDTSVDRILGLELGADDYIGKPFELGELRARIRSVLRRSQGMTETELAESAEALTFNGWTLDLTHHRLLDPEGQEIPLTGGEFALLRVFAEHPRRPLSRDQLLDLTRSREWSPFDRSIDVLVGRVRRKLGGAGDMIKTARNVGYMLSADVRKRRLPAGTRERRATP